MREGISRDRIGRPKRERPSSRTSISPILFGSLEEGHERGKTGMVNLCLRFSEKICLSGLSGTTDSRCAERGLGHKGKTAGRGDRHNRNGSNHTRLNP